MRHFIWTIDYENTAVIAINESENDRPGAHGRHQCESSAGLLNVEVPSNAVTRTAHPNTETESPTRARSGFGCALRGSESTPPSRWHVRQPEVGGSAR